MALLCALYAGAANCTIISRLFAADLDSQTAETVVAPGENGAQDSGDAGLSPAESVAGSESIPETEVSEIAEDAVDRADAVDMPSEGETTAGDDQAGAAAVEAVPDAVERTAGEVPTVYVIPIHDAIGKPTLFIIRRGLKQAIEEGVDTVVLDMDTPGGRVDVTLDIMKSLDKFDGQTLTYVNVDAISAGAFIAASTDEIYFAPKSQIGAAAVINITGEDVAETAKQKLESYMRAVVKNYSGDSPYRADVVRAMMEADYVLEIDGTVIKPAGELLSLTGKEALEEYGDPPQPLLGAGIAEDLTDLLDSKFGENGYVIESFEITWSEDLAQYLSVIAPALMGIGLILLFVEFKTPGFGVFGISGITLIAIVFASNYVAGLAGHEPIMLFFVGLILLAVEIFILPGTMIFATLGIACVFGSLVWSLADIWPSVPNEPFAIDFSPLWPAFEKSVLAFFIAVVGAVIIWRVLPRSGFESRLVVAGTSASPDPVIAGGGSAILKPSSLPDIGTRGVVISALHPVGAVEIDGHRYEAQVEVGAVSKGEPVVVVGYGQFHLSVEKAD